MFGKKKKDLKRQIADLTLRLSEERRAHEADAQELESLRGRIELEERALRELQDACREKLRDMQADAAQQRAKLEEELSQQRAETERNIQEKIGVFGSNYVFYLGQVGRLMDKLTEAADTAWQEILSSADADPTEIFRARMSGALRPQEATAVQDGQDKAVGEPDPTGEDEGEEEIEEYPPSPHAWERSPGQGDVPPEKKSRKGNLFPVHKVICLVLAAAMLPASVGFAWLGQQTRTPRYNQHLDAPSEAELGPCERCGGTSTLCTHLPIIRIDTGGQKIPGAAILNDQLTTIGYETGENGEEEILASVSTVEEPDVWHHVEDEASLSAHALIRYRGNTSRSFTKHGYRIKLVDGQNPVEDVNMALLGMNAESEWALHGPFLDKTLIRNYMWMNISAEVMGYAPDVRFCELIVDGEYQGVYLLMETITQGDGRVELTEYQPGDVVTSYILRLGSRMNPLKIIENFTYYTNRLELGTNGVSKEVEILYPTTVNQTRQVQEYVRADFSEIERLLYSSHMNDGSRQWQDVIDMESFVNYFILQELLMVNDAFTESTYFYRDVRGKLHMGPVWDYNNCLDNFLRPVPVDEFILNRRGWYGQLMMDRDFVEAVIYRYNSLRQGLLSDERLTAYVEETIAWLGSAVNRNFEVWGYTFDITSPQLTASEYRRPSLGDMETTVADLNPASYEEAVEWMLDTLLERADWLDHHIDSLRQFYSSSKNMTRIIE